MTFGNVIDDVEAHLYSFGMQRDKVTTLTAEIGEQDTLLDVADGRMVDHGLLEIGMEMMAVSAVDTSSGVVTLHPWGRGQRGTQATVHSAGSKVVSSPRFPRSSIAKAVQKTVATLYPDLYRIQAEESIIASAGRVSYALDPAAESVISVSYELPGPTGRWLQLTRYRMSNTPSLTDFPTGKSIDIYDSVLPGRPIRVVYRTSFGLPVNESESLESLGLLDRWADLIVYGAAGNLILGMEALRLQSDAVETQERAEGVQASQATSVARQLLGMFKTRIMEERSLLHRQHPPVMTRHF